MALFTDGPPADIEYLRSYESAIQDLAETEAIDLEAKLFLAADDIGDAVLRFLLTNGTRESQAKRRADGLTGVVVTPSMRRWHAIRTIELVYRDAFGTQANERYTRKVAEYAAASARAMEECLRTGIGIAVRPVPKAKVPAASGSGGETQTCLIQAAWIGASGVEGAPSEAATVSLGPGAEVTLPGSPPLGVSGWNLYAGITRDNIVLQNPTPLPAGSPWVWPGSIAANGPGPGSGPKPDYFVADNHVLPRG